MGQGPSTDLDKATACRFRVQNMISPWRCGRDTTMVQFNHAQCECLFYKLKEAIHVAEMHFKQKPIGGSYKADRLAQRLLLLTAIQVESFIRGCCKDPDWIQAAMVLANMTEHVSQLISDLKTCMSSFYHGRELPMTAYDSFTVEGRVSWDHITLLTRLETVIHSSNSSYHDSQLLAQCLANRVRQYLSKSVPVLWDWEIQYSSLKSGQKLGAGSFGEVHKSCWLGLDVAEKIFIGSDYPSFIKEVEILAGLNHPNIVPLIGYATDRNKCCIVMELMDGNLRSLMRDRLRQHETHAVPFLDYEEVNLMLQTAEGMRYLHDKRIVHRDLKALNILVKSVIDSDGQHAFINVKVADFGLSKTKASSITHSNQTPNTGSTRWMAPELMSSRGAGSEPRYPFKVDVYSFGMLCYEILTGEVPFPTISNVEVRRMVLNGDRPVLPNRCPEVFRSLISSCWEAEAKRRPSFVDICARLRFWKFNGFKCF